MKALIVEDELLARAGLHSLVEWDKMGITFLEDARDGREALERIERQRPDLLLLDINIPEISGLELLGIIKKRRLPIKTIVISCYDDFETVKEAMKSGAADYIRKFGLSKEELTAVLAGVLERPGEAMGVGEAEGPGEAAGPGEAEGPAGASKSVAQTDSEIRRELQHIPAEYRTGCCLSFYLRGKYAGEQTDLKIVETIVSQYYQKLGRKILSICYEGKLLVLMGEQAGKGESEALHSQIAPFVPGDCYIGVTAYQDPDKDPQFFVRVANTIEAYAFYDPEVKIVCFDRPLEIQKHYPFDVAACMEALEAGIAKISEEEIQAALDRMFDEIGRHRYLSVNLIKRLMIEALSRFSDKAGQLGGSIEEIEVQDSYKHYQKIVGVNNLAGLRLWWDEFAARFAAQFFTLQKSAESDIIQNTLSYIEENIGRAIQLSEAAKYIGVSEPYLSSFFKKRMNENFIPYVNRRKVKRAKELLADGLMVYQVSDMLGYENSTYFSKVFKRLEGVTPEAYRKQLRGLNAGAGAGAEAGIGMRAGAEAGAGMRAEAEAGLGAEAAE